MDGTFLGLYADDTVIAARSWRPNRCTKLLQNAIGDLEGWCIKWKVELNAAKTQAIMIRRSKKAYQKPDIRIRIRGEEIEWSDKVKYLGVTIDKGLRWQPHIDGSIAKARMAEAILRPLLGRDSQLSVHNKKLLYQACIRPILTYASAAWGYAAKCHTERLQRLENRILRRILRAPWYVRNRIIFRDLGMKISVGDFIREHARKVFDQATRHDNPLVRQAVDYDPRFRERIKGPKSLMLTGHDTTG